MVYCRPRSTWIAAARTGALSRLNQAPRAEAAIYVAVHK